jgi:hypothetical protein
LRQKVHFCERELTSRHTDSAIGCTSSTLLCGAKGSGKSFILERLKSFCSEQLEAFHGEKTTGDPVNWFSLTRFSSEICVINCTEYADLHRLASGLETLYSKLETLNSTYRPVVCLDNLDAIFRNEDEVFSA